MRRVQRLSRGNAGPSTLLGTSRRPPRPATAGLGPRGASPAEILLALVVLGAVAFLAVVAVRSERARTRDAIRIADMSQLAAAFRAIEVVEGSYRSAGATCAEGDSVTKCTFGTYLPNAARIADPLGAPYRVQKVPGAEGFAVAFTLERGVGSYNRGQHLLTESGIR